IAALVSELGCLSLQSRAARLRGLVSPTAEGKDFPDSGDSLRSSLNTDDFEGFRRDWERPQMHAVFTGHPTFLLTPGQHRSEEHTSELQSLMRISYAVFC